MPRARSNATKLQDLKDRLWNMVIQVDFDMESIGKIEGFPEYDAWDGEMQKVKLPKVPPITVPSFKISTGDLVKIKSEVEDSCLSNEAKKAILAAVGKAK